MQIPVLFSFVNYTIKCPSRWPNLDFLESLGPEEWEKHKACAEFKLFVKQFHHTILLLETLEHGLF